MNGRLIPAIVVCLGLGRAGVRINNAVTFGEAWSNTPFYYAGKKCDGLYRTDGLAGQTCETPANIGAPNGPY
jgi:hypothetical protein